MKKVLIFIFVFVLFFVAIFFNLKIKNENFENGEIKIFCWGQYIADGSEGSLNILDLFEKENKIKIKSFSTFDSCEQMYTKLKNANSNYDIIFCCEYLVNQLIAENLIAPINFSKLKNYKNIDEKFKGSFWGYDEKNMYTVPYCWGHLAILYNKNMVEALTKKDAKEVVKGWDVLWNPKLKQEILMLVNSRDSFSVAHKLLNHSINTTKKNDVTAAFNLLKKQKPLVQAYVMDEMFDKMENNEAAVCVAYSGDIVNMMKNNKQLRYCFPKQGSNIFIDTICIPSNAKNKENALKFIDFLCREDIAAKNAEFLSASTPNKKAVNFLKDDFKNNKIICPEEQIIKKCEANICFSKQQNTLLEQLFLNVKTF